MAIWPALLSHGDRAWGLLALGAAGVCAVAAGCVVARTPPIAVGIALLGAEYALQLVLDDPPLDARAALFAAGLLAAAELGVWSTELRREVSHAPGVQLRRLVAEVAVVLSGLVLSALVLTAGDLGAVGGLGVELAGAAAAVALAALAVSALRR